MTKEAKTKSAALDREVWLAEVEEPRQDEARKLLSLFAEVTGWEPRLWEPSIVGFGRYEYRYDSGHGGESLATGFSPRKAELSIYLMPGGAPFETLLAGLGPHRMGKGCLYIKRLSAVDDAVLRAVIRAGLDDLARQWPVHPL